MYKKEVYTGYLNIHGTHVTANYSTNNNVAFFFVSNEAASHQPKKISTHG